MLKRLSDNLLLNDNAIISAESRHAGGWRLELVNGNHIDVDEETFDRIFPKPGRKKRDSDASDK